MEFKIKLPTLKISQKELLDDLKRVSSLVSCTTLKRAEYERHGHYACTSFRNHFGTWKKALENAGLSRGRNWGATPQDLFVNLKEVWVKLGRQPKYADMKIPFWKFSSTTYAHHFGNWTKALVAFEKHVEVGTTAEESVQLPESEIVHNPIGRKTSRQPNWQIRFMVMKRDHFRCVACGRSPAKDPEIELHVDHIVPWSKGGETVTENLQTLCIK